MERGLELIHIQKAFGAHSVLKDVNLTVRPGEFIAIVGRSGCGKSTLLRLISQLEEPSSGQILWNGKPVIKGQLPVRFLFQEPRLLPWKRIWENIALFSRTHKKEDALAVLDQVALKERAQEWPSVLSGGQKQRVALARALATEPEILLLDEPLGALDALTRMEMQALIETLWREKHMTAILVTHDVGEAVCLADRVIMVENGQIQMDEDIALARPRERDASFSYYEKRILDRVLDRRERVEDEAQKYGEYQI